MRLSALVLLLTAVVCAPVLAGAKEDVAASMQKLASAKSFHATIAHTGQQAMTTEADFVAPNRYRMKLPMGEQIIIGDTMHMNMDGRRMAIPMPKGTLPDWRSPGNISQSLKTMTAQAQGSELLGGKLATKYLVHQTQPQPSDMILWVGGNGMPLQIRVTGKAAGQTITSTIRYSRFNDPTIRIEAPK